jgi:enoyl-CoA hydratase
VNCRWRRASSSRSTPDDRNPSGRQLDRAIEWAGRIAAQAPLAVRATIRNARTAVDHGPAAAIAELDPVQLRLMANEDVAEGVASFREKRDARFSGK